MKQEVLVYPRWDWKVTPFHSSSMILRLGVDMCLGFGHNSTNRLRKILKNDGGQ